MDLGAGSEGKDPLVIALAWRKVGVKFLPFGACPASLGAASARR